MAYRCLIYDEERKLDATLRRLFQEHIGEVRSGTPRTDEGVDRLPDRRATPDTASL